MSIYKAIVWTLGIVIMLSMVIYQFLILITLNAKLNYIIDNQVTLRDLSKHL